ncbi:alpha/beta fold hydrolase [Scytonema sp. UIC 10036]|uniref:alpha/beta hydrolase n=1 Tax=Scytonema sp. UIC 10036 TaxID=2304196 RepID=UPI0012DACC5B|nr:alpha/beta hydrolase [Scytonema sp. UIC 10036]MUG98993.1 alpha/beta fold hydrolase [Scytonema sp. UIC 10036]
MFNKQLFKKLVVGDFTWQRLVRSLLLIYFFVVGYVFFRADSMIFLPQPSSYQDTKEIIKLTSTNRTKLSAIYLFNPSAKYTILYTHGNAEDLGDIHPILERLQSLNFNIFAYDYRGYGTSEGKPTEQYAYEDIETAYNYLTQHLKVPPNQIIVFGRSVGGGSAVDLAARKSVAGLIVESTFISAFRVVVPFPILPFDKFNNFEKIKRVNCPVLVMHGRADETIPFSHGEQLFAAAPSPKLFLWVNEATHNDFMWVAGERYDNIFQDFVKLVERHSHILHGNK